MNGGVGVQVLSDSPNILIEGNQVVGWNEGIQSFGTGNIIRKNKVALNDQGIHSHGPNMVTANVVAASVLAITLRDSASAVGNASYGNSVGLMAEESISSGVIEKNNLVGNFNGTQHCGLYNDKNPGLLARNNYWGAATGPGAAPPANEACNDSPGTTTTTPFATKPFKVNAAIKP